MHYGQGARNDLRTDQAGAWRVCACLGRAYQPSWASPHAPCLQPQLVILASLPQVQQAVLAAEQPDLAALTGDQVSGFAWDGSDAWLEERWRQLLQPTLAARVPHASILGNHDGAE